MDGKYADSNLVIELSLKEYLKAEEECRLQCEGPMLEKYNEELFVAITSKWYLVDRFLWSILICFEEFYGTKMVYIYFNMATSFTILQLYFNP